MDSLTSPGSNTKIIKAPKPGSRTLVEAELVDSVAWLIRLRWLVGVGVLLGTWSTGGFFGLRAPTIPLYAIGAGILVYNLAFYLVERGFTQTSAATVAFRRLSVWTAGMD